MSEVVETSSRTGGKWIKYLLLAVLLFISFGAGKMFGAHHAIKNMSDDVSKMYTESKKMQEKEEKIHAEPEAMSSNDDDHEAEEASEKPENPTKEIAPGVYSFGPGSGYYSMFVVTDRSVAVFESVNTPHATQLLEEIRKITDLPISYAFHSHNHWDHSSGGKVFQDVGAKTVMHTKAAQWLDANPGQDTTPPDMVWSGARRDITLDDITIELHYLGMNHGLGMTVFVIPELEVGYIADIVTPNRVMFSIVPDFNIKEWERSLEEILELDFATAVCSHNELPINEAENGCTKVHIKEELQFIRDVRNAIFAEFQKGTPPNKIPSTVKLPQYKDWKHYDDWLELNVQRMLLDLWMGPYPWIAE